LSSSILLRLLLGENSAKTLSMPSSAATASRPADIPRHHHHFNVAVVESAHRFLRFWTDDVRHGEHRNHLPVVREEDRRLGTMRSAIRGLAQRGR